MEDECNDPNGSQPRLNIHSMEDDVSGRQSQWRSMDDNINWLWEKTSMEDNLN